jgi:hypothetical protein
VLFGDSHSEQYAPGLDLAAKKAHWKLVVWGRSACPAAKVTVYAPFLKRNYTECDDWRSLTLEKIIKLKPDLVVMSQSDDAAGAVAATTWANGTYETVLTSRKVHVTFLLDSPLPGIDVPGCVSDHLKLVRSCVVTLDKAYDKPALRAGASHAAARGGAFVVDPVAWMCTSAGCPVIVGNTLVWRDTGHITATYSRWLAPVLGTLLRIPAAARPHAST